MRKILFAILLGSSLLSFPMVSGCEDKVSTTKTETTTHRDGSTTVDKTKTSVDSNGNSSKTTEHTSTP